MLASTAAEQSIGILSIDYADKNRGNLRSLYLQAKGQTCGYLPDSNKNAFDKMNVRDGHYPLWGYVHFFTPVGPGGVPSDAAKAMVTRFSIARLDQGLIDNIIGASLIPQCAMKVDAQRRGIGLRARRPICSAAATSTSRRRARPAARPARPRRTAPPSTPPATTATAK